MGDIQDLINKSGSNLHIKTEKILNANNWKAEIKKVYLDSATDKEREGDIVAFKELEVKNYGMTGYKFKIFLIIECKYIDKSKNLLFRMNKNDPEKSFKALILNNFHLSSGEERELRFAFKPHHYLTRPSVGQFIISEEEKNIHKAIQQSTNLLLFQKEQDNLMGIYYPVVVYDGIDGIQELNKEENSADKVIKVSNSLFPEDHVLKNDDSSKPTYQQYFLVDFIHINELENFLNIVVDELKGFQDFLRFKALTTPTRPKTIKRTNYI